MAATIQTIQKPTRARALDTSTSEQIVTSNLVSGDDSTFAAGTGVWSGVRGTAAHDTNQLKFTTDNTYHTDANTMSSYPIGIYDANFFASGQPGDDIAVGDRVKVKFTAKHSSTSNLDCAVPFGYIGESVLGDSDLKVISNPNMTTSYQDYEFNFTTNPSFLDDDGNLRYTTMENNPKVYITTVGLYNDTNDLVAVAKLSQPIAKDFSKEALIRVKLDY